MDQVFTVSGDVQIFPRDGGWHYLAVPPKISKPLEELADRGLIAIAAKIGGSEWDTSMLPKGDGTHFIPLPSKVRKSEVIEVGDKVKLSFKLRVR